MQTCQAHDFLQMSTVLPHWCGRYAVAAISDSTNQVSIRYPVCAPCLQFLKDLGAVRS